MILSRPRTSLVPALATALGLLVTLPAGAVERLELKTVVRFGSLTKKSLEAALVKYFQNDDEAKRCFDSIMESLGSREVEVLKRLKNRKRKANDQPGNEPASKAKKTEEGAPELSDEDEDY